MRCYARPTSLEGGSSRKGRALTDGDPVLIPLHSKHTSALRLEVLSVRGSAPFSDPTAGIAVHAVVAGHTTIDWLFLRFGNGVSKGRRLYGEWRRPTTGVPVKFWFTSRAHPGAVCQVIWLCSLSCTPSKISISPSCVAKSKNSSVQRAILADFSCPEASIMR